MAFVQRLIDFSITVKSSRTAPASAQGQTVKLSRARASVKIVKSGSVGNTASASIWGLKRSFMNQLATLGMRYNALPFNPIVIEAGDEKNGMYTVFAGNIQDAWADYNTPADVPLRLTTQIGGEAAVLPATPTSFAGGVDVNVLMKSIADKAGYLFETSVPNGTMIADPYHSGSARSQMKKVADAANVNWTLDDGSPTNNTRGVLAIWPRTGSRPGAPVRVSAETGMIGYPAFTPQGIVVKSLFNPAVRFGGVIEVESTIKPACGKWAVISLDHDLNTQVPNGQWFTTMSCCDPTFVGTV
jgi:hypothetical protein